MGRLLASIVCAALVLGACGGDDPGPITTASSTTATAAPSTTATVRPPSTTTDPVTTSAPSTLPPTTTSEGPPRVFLPHVSLGPPPSYPGSAGASGSGCHADTGPPADGAWFGNVGAADAAGVTFDLACFYFGPIAQTEAAADGAEAPGGFYIRNSSPLTRDVAIPPATPVYTIDASTGNTFLELTFADWPSGGGGYIPCPGEYCGVWISITEGLVTGLVEQYLP
ncbi:MAG TPA: hypothetical protein VLD62_11190 [Acidimicrobiia bacterium]|nr:hypothetical protein [Acidimicrobiia bacterium]